MTQENEAEQNLAYADHWSVGDVTIDMIEVGYLITREGGRQVLTTDLVWISEHDVKVDPEHDHSHVTFLNLTHAIDLAKALKFSKGWKG